MDEVEDAEPLGAGLAAGGDFCLQLFLDDLADVDELGLFFRRKIGEGAGQGYSGR